MDLLRVMQAAGDAAGDATASPPAQTHSGGGGGITVNFPTIDWTTLIPTIVPDFFNAFAKTLGTTGQDMLKGLGLTGNDVNFLWQTPTKWTTEWDAVKQIQDAEINGINLRIAIITVFLVIVGFQVLTGREDFWEGLIRIGFAIIASQAVTWWAGLMIDIFNGLANAVVATPMDLSKVSIPNTLDLGILLIVAVWFAIKALLKGFVGTMLIAALLATGPFALLFLGIRQTERWGKWWVNQFVPWVIRPLAVALVMRFGLGIAAGIGDNHLQLLAAIAAFWLMDKAPDWLRGGDLSANAWAAFGQQQLLARAADAAGLAAGGLGIGARVAGTAAAGGAAGVRAAAWEAGQTGQMAASGVAHAASAYSDHIHS
jgi:hypothetical protein